MRVSVASWLMARSHLLVMGFILGLALFLRLYGIDWDQGALYHPDERAILMKVNDLSFPWGNLSSLFTRDSTMNPAWFPYGSLPLYILKLVAFIAPPWFQNPDLERLAIVGRALSAVFDVATISLIYLIAARFFGKWAGVLAASFIALAVIHIQQSHFFVTDIMLATWLAASFYFLTRAAAGSAKSFLLAGLFFGLALSTKASSAPFVLAFVAAAGIYIAGSESGTGGRREQWKRAAGWLALAAGVAAVAFVVTEPYAIIDWHRFVGDVGRESQMVRRIVDFPYTRQYIDTTPYLYHVKQLAVFGLGLPLGILLWAGLAFGAVGAVFRRDRPYILLASWVIPYFLFIGSFDVKFMRYMLPLTPFLAIMAAGMLAAIFGWLLRRDWQWARFAAAYAVTLAMVFTVFYALAYANVYSRPHPANAAAEWILHNVPAGSTLLQDSGWEEGFRGLDPYYKQIRMEIYDEDTTAKRQSMTENLAKADYLLFYSNRQYGTIPRLPDRYPMTNAYYQMLFGEQLGFQLAHWETSYPNLYAVAFVDDTFSRPDLPTPEAIRRYKDPGISLSINLGSADESFTVYDHPKVLIFKKTLAGTPAEQRQFFDSKLPPPRQLAASEPRLMLSPGDARAQQEGGTWSRLFNRGSIINRVPAVPWLVLMELAFLITLPITMTLFRRLPDRGYLLGKTLALVLMAYIPWLLASLRWMPFGRLSIVLGLAVLALLSAAMLALQRREMLRFLREHRRLVVIGEALFLTAFLGFYAVRLWNPDLWQADMWVSWIQQFGRGGEKPMDFAFFNAVVRSTYMPPYDPWYAGGYLNYYYWGQFMAAVPTKLLGIVPSKAIVLALPLFFALTVTAAFSIVYNLASMVEGRRKSFRGLRPAGMAIDPQPSLPPDPGAGVTPSPAGGERGVAPRRPWWRRALGALPMPVWAGLLAALFVAVAGNMDGIIQLSQGVGHVLTGKPFGTFDYWRSSRMMPSDLEGITEFPYFTFLFADPHAHLFVIPLTLLALGLAAAIVAGPHQRLPFVGRLAILPFLALGLLLGAILATNSWDVVTYAAIGAIAVIIAEYGARQRFDPAFLVQGAVKVAMLAALSLLFFFPYFQHYEVPIPDRGSSLLGSFPLIGSAFGTIRDTFHRNETVTQLYRYLAIYGLFVFLVLSLLIFDLFRGHPAREGRPYGRGYAALPPVSGGSIGPTAAAPRMEARLRGALLTIGSRWLAYLGGGLLLLAIAFGMGYATIGFLLAVLLLLAPLVVREVGVRDSQTPVRLLIYLIVAMPLALGIFVDLFTFASDIGRLNTVFKFYLQAWVMLALASGYALWRLRFGEAIPWKGVRRGWQALVALLIACALIYPVMATPMRAKARFALIPPTQDGMTYMNTAVYSDDDKKLDLRWDRMGIEWLQDHVQGSPVIIEGLTPLYRWGNRVSVYTGLPAVIGWDHHEKQQRGDYVGRPSGVDARRREVDLFYTTRDVAYARGLLSKYNVQYVYVGQLEQAYYPREGLAKFEAMLGHGVELAYANEQVRIYRVIP